MSLNNQGRIHLERSGPWIGVGGLFVLLWIAVASSQFAPWWGVVLYVALLIPGAVFVSRLARTNPRRAAFVPLGNLAVWAIITAIGLSFWGWKTDPTPTSSAARVLAAQCATKFDALRLEMGMNPGQPGTPLEQKWDEAHTEVRSLSERAEAGDCPRGLDALGKQISGIERLSAIVDQYDMVRALAGAEADFDLSRPSSDKEPPLSTKLRRAFETLRVHAPLSNRDLATKFATVERTDPVDGTAFTQSLADLRTAALTNENYRQCKQALKVIGGYPQG